VDNAELLLLELMEILLENEIQTYDSLLLAIEEEYVEGVELLLEHEERVWHQGTPHSWEVSAWSCYWSMRRGSGTRVHPTHGR
jgi:hypothetical protein